jgi:hypothetical protein
MTNLFRAKKRFGGRRRTTARLSFRLIEKAILIAFVSTMLVVVSPNQLSAGPEEEGPLQLLKVSIKCLVAPEKIVEDDHVTYSQERIATYTGTAKKFEIVVTKKENILWEPIVHNEYVTRDTLQFSDIQSVKVRESLLTLTCKARRDCNRLQSTLKYDSDFSEADDCQRSKFCKEGKQTRTRMTSTMSIRFCSEQSATDAADAVKELMRLATETR